MFFCSYMYMYVNMSCYGEDALVCIHELSVIQLQCSLVVFNIKNEQLWKKFVSSKKLMYVSCINIQTLLFELCINVSGKTVGK